MRASPKIEFVHDPVMDRREGEAASSTAGDVLVFGEPAGTLTARRWVGLAEQDINLDRFLTVEETLAMV